MEKTYFVKTRNWYSKYWVFGLLSISHSWGTYRGDSYEDGDGKFCYESNSLLKASLIFCYFKALAPLSGGWTYIQNTKTHPNLLGNKSLYL